MTHASNFNKLKQIDLNSIIFFVAYMKYRKISIVSAVLKCSNSTVSIMLHRFCLNFDDAVFERRSRNLTPTPFAFDLLIKCDDITSIMCDLFLDYSVIDASLG